MAKKYDGSGKYKIGPGDLEVRMSQCAFCRYNTRKRGDKECEIYGPKPPMYFTNAKDCPYKDVAPEK